MYRFYRAINFLFVVNFQQLKILEILKITHWTARFSITLQMPWKFVITSKNQQKRSDLETLKKYHLKSNVSTKFGDNLMISYSKDIVIFKRTYSLKHLIH